MHAAPMSTGAVMRDSGKPAPERSTRRIEFSRGSCWLDKRFLHAVRDAGCVRAQQPSDIPPAIHAVAVVQPGPGIAAAILEAANYGELVGFIQQVAASRVPRHSKRYWRLDAKRCRGIPGNFVDFFPTI